MQKNQNNSAQLSSKFQLTKICAIISCILINVNSCGVDVEDASLPLSPQWIEKSLQDEWPEYGIDAHELGGIVIEIECKIEVYAYLLYRSFQDDITGLSSKDSLIGQIMVESNDDLKFLDRETELGVKYSYKCRALDNTGNLSPFSDSLTFMLLPSISISTMVPNGVSVPLPDSRKLQWAYDHHIEMEEYCLTILTEENTLVSRKSFAPSNYINNTEYWTIPQSVPLEIGARYKWRIDVGANYLNGVEGTGSESLWATFQYDE
jgi:hypothetical protein